jgi:hypothetical protein
MDGTGPGFGSETVNQPLLTGGMEGTALDAGGLACPWLPDLALLLRLSGSVALSDWRSVDLDNVNGWLCPVREPQGVCNWMRAGCTDDTSGLLGPSLLTFLACSEWFRALWIGERVMTAPTSLSSQPRLGKLPAHRGRGQAARQRVEVMG